MIPPYVRPKKQLGQHFLHDENIARKIVQAFTEACHEPVALEVGPGMGVLSKYLIQQKEFTTWLCEIDQESVVYLKQHYPELGERILQQDFLQLDFNSVSSESLSVIGNFPYNISSQIVFKIIENRHKVPLMVGMFQREVAQRLAGVPSTKEYGILSVITQAYYKVEYLFTVGEGAFQPPPNVKSAVVRLKRREDFVLNCDEKLFLRVLKAAFNQRRKTLRNALSVFQPDQNERLLESGYLKKRAEELSVADFVQLSRMIGEAN
jgi:16S rRNA (adenine1518-N6/adenine1519-N6)-dimethyltransferase